MDNNQNELNRLINEFSVQKKKDRKHLLKIEIAKATDRSVKKALQNILDDMERQERRNRIIGLVLFLIIGTVFFYILGVQSSKKEKLPVPTIKSSTTEISEISTTREEQKKEVVKEKNLTESEVKQWVSVVWDKKMSNTPKNTNYDLSLKIDDTDGLVYVDVKSSSGATNNLLSKFRINAKGELEESGDFIDEVSQTDWILVSDKFMDVSQVDVRKTEIKEERETQVDLTAKEFAELFAKWSNSDHPIMPISEYSEKYGHIDHYDDSIQIITYNDNDINRISFSESTPYRMSNFFYTYDNEENKAYLNRNNASGEKEYLEELTIFIERNR